MSGINASEKRVGCRKKLLFIWMIIYKKNLWTVKQSVLAGGWIKEGKEGWRTFSFSSKQCLTWSVFIWASNTPEQTVGGNKFGEGEGKKQRLTKRWWWMEIGFTFSAMRWADAVLDLVMQQLSLQAQERSEGLSALFAPGAPMFATTGPQQCLQSHLHKCLEVIASLPSAVLRRGWNTDRYLHWRHSNHCISFHTDTEVLFNAITYERSQ